MSWMLSLAVAIAAACCCDRAVTARIAIADDVGLNTTRIGGFLLWKAGSFLVKGLLGGDANNAAEGGQVAQVSSGLDPDAVNNAVKTAMENATPAMEEAAAESAKAAVENGLQEVFSDPNTYQLLGEHGGQAALDVLATHPGVQPLVAETTANAVGTALDTAASHEVGQFAMWAVSGSALFSVLNLGVSVMTLMEIKKGFAKVENAIKQLEATVEKGLSRIYDKLDEIKDVLQLQFLNDATAQIEMSWQSMMYCVKHAVKCESTADFEGLATSEKRQKIAMGLQRLDTAIRGQPNAMKLTKIDLMVRIVNLALQRAPQLNHQQVRAAAWNYWGELMILQVKGATVLEYMSKSEALRSDLWGVHRLQADLDRRLDMQRARIKEIFDSMEVEGYYLRSKAAQSCLWPGRALDTLQYEGDCTVPNQQKMIFNVVPMQAVHLPFKPGQAVEYLMSDRDKLRGVVKNVQKDFFLEDLEAGIPAEGLLDIVYPDGRELKTGAFFNRTRRLWSDTERHQFFLRHKESKKCLTLNAMSKITIGKLKLSDTLTNIEKRDADVDKSLFHISPADLDGSFYLDFVDPWQSGELKCVKPGWYQPSKLTGFKSYFANRLKIGHKPCQDKSDPYPRLAFEMLFSVQEVPAKASMALPWSSVRPRDNDKELQKALSHEDDEDAGY